jgi:hypothetical protein
MMNINDLYICPQPSNPDFAVYAEITKIEDGKITYLGYLRQGRLYCGKRELPENNFLYQYRPATTAEKTTFMKIKGAKDADRER